MKHLNKVTIIITFFLTVNGISFTAYAEPQYANDAAGVVDSAVTMNQAAAAALEVIPGTLAKIEFTDNDGKENEKADNGHTIIRIVQPLRKKHHPAHHTF